MRIHTDHLTPEHLVRAASLAEVEFADGGFSAHNSRKRTKAYEVKLTGNSARYPMGGRDENDAHAATWDQWGVFLGYLYSLEYNMAAGEAYGDVYKFDLATNERFALDYSQPIPFPLDHDHRWEFTGSAREFECVKCGAIKRH